MVEINDKAKKIDLFDGLNVHPIPLDFTNSLTTTEFLLALQNKVNELVDSWNSSFEKIKEYTQEEQNRIIEIVTNSIDTIQEELTNLINTEKAETEEKIETTKTELTETINNVRTDLLAKITNLETILNLVSDGETIDLSTLFNNYNNLNGNFSNIKSDFESIERQFVTLKKEVTDFTNNVALCVMFPQEDIELPETLINDSIESLSLTYSSKKINSLLKEIRQNITNTSQIVETIGNDSADNRDEMEREFNSIRKEISDVYTTIESEIESSERRILNFVESEIDKLRKEIIK